MSFERVWEAQSEAVSEIRHSVIAFVQEVVELSEQRLHDIALAVTEAASNAVVHAFPNGDGDGSIHVMAELDDPKLRIALTDNGVGMSVRNGEPGLGLGLPLMAHIADGIEITAVEGGGTRVGLQFLVEEMAGVRTPAHAWS
jgi:anti-sigma regulatory factor (Ser/Thr protein kinase)